MKVILLTSIVLVTLHIALSNEEEAKRKHIICYYGTWATYRPGDGKFDVEDVDTDLCTHLMYSFVGINDEGYVISLDPQLDLPDDDGHDNFGKFNALKEKNPDLKTVLAVGGWSEGSARYSVMAADPELRSNFINSALDMVLTHGFDGFDVDWEYPNRRDTVHGEADIDNFTQLIKELKEEFSKHGLIVTAAVSAVEAAAKLSYDIPAICEYLDLVGLMTYDMYGAWDNVTGHNAGLHKGEGDEDVAREDVWTVDIAVEYWLNQGCPPEKLVMGLPIYGRSFNLTDPDVNGVRAPTNGAGVAGPFTMAAGSVGYNEFCDMLRTQSWDVRYDPLAKVPYAVQGHDWVSYDDGDSLTEKINWGLQRNLSGILLWSIETDDFHGICGEKFAMLKAINKAIDNFEYEEWIVEDNSEEVNTEEEDNEEEDNEEENNGEGNNEATSLKATIMVLVSLISSIVYMSQVN